MKRLPVIASAAFLWGSVGQVDAGSFVVNGWAGGKPNASDVGCFGDNYGGAINVCSSVKSYFISLAETDTFAGTRFFYAWGTNATCFFAYSFFDRGFPSVIYGPVTQLLPIPSGAFLGSAYTNGNGAAELVCNVYPNGTVYTARILD